MQAFENSNKIFIEDTRFLSGSEAGAVSSDKCQRCNACVREVGVFLAYTEPCHQAAAVKNIYVYIYITYLKCGQNLAFFTLYPLSHATTEHHSHLLGVLHWHSYTEHSSGGSAEQESIAVCSSLNSPALHLASAHLHLIRVLPMFFSFEEI